jgi:formylglycine-generating enzyme required for sulfatase activity
MRPNTPTSRSESITTPTYRPGQIRINSIDGSEMVYVPAGSFTMGAWPENGYNVCVDYPPEDMDSDDCRSSWYERESPPHELYISAFWIQKTEVSIDQYRKCVAEGQCRSSDQKGRPSNHPVTNITWEQARKYCQWTGLDLPTEAQWEKAARGPTNRLWPWGNLANTSYLNTAEAGINDTTSVGSYPDGASYYGLLDMGGNVWEFVYDWFDKDFYQSSAATQDDTRGPLTSPENQRVRRGGGYGGEISGDINDGRVAARQGVGAKFPSYGVGFRCAGSELP